MPGIKEVVKTIECASAGSNFFSAYASSISAWLPMAGA
jgi:hypothetical protein